MTTTPPLNWQPIPRTAADPERLGLWYRAETERYVLTVRRYGTIDHPEKYGYVVRQVVNKIVQRQPCVEVKDVAYSPNKAKQAAQDWLSYERSSTAGRKSKAIK